MLVILTVCARIVKLYSERNVTRFPDTDVRPVTQTASTTRERILDSAFVLFGRYGFKRTSMEDIASEAGLSRAALYLQFRSKEDIFRALATALHEQSLSAAESALAGPGGLEERLTLGVEAKTLPMIEIAYGSPHGNELIDEQNRLCGDLATQSDQRFHRLLTAVLQDAAEKRDIDLPTAGLTPDEAADLFARATYGLKSREISAETYRRRLSSFVRVFVAGLRGRPTPRRSS
jgi:AcrR family transcriptional regulator